MSVDRRLKRLGAGLMVGPALAGGLLLAGGHAAVLARHGTEGIRAMTAAVLLVVAVIYVTLVPAMARMTRASVQERFRIAWQAGVKRFVFTLAAGVLIAWAGKVEQTVFLFWMGAAYAVLILVETITLAYWSRRLESS